MIDFEKINNFLEKSKGVMQNSRHHTENLYVHTILVTYNLLQKTNSKCFVFAGLLHDTGKMECKQFVENKGWTFHGHAYKSAENLKNYISEDEIIFKPIYNLIYTHMAFADCNEQLESVKKFLKRRGYNENYYKNIMLFRESDYNASIKDEKLIPSNDIIEKYRKCIFDFLAD